MNFSWVPFYRELAGKVLEFENRQDELLALLREMKKDNLYVVPLEDDISPTERVAFTEIDPFTFLANFSRTSDKEATKLCDWIRVKWNLTTPTPTDFDGRANVHPQGGASWFFASTQRGRKAQDIPCCGMWHNWSLKMAYLHLTKLFTATFSMLRTLEPTNFLRDCFGFGHRNFFLWWGQFFLT